MDEHTAVFEIDTVGDAYAVERLLERLYDSVREESRTLRRGSMDSTATLAQFERLRDAAKQPTPGRLTVTYESLGDEFAE